MSVARFVDVLLNVSLGRNLSFRSERKLFSLSCLFCRGASYHDVSLL